MRRGRSRAGRRVGSATESQTEEGPDATNGAVGRRGPGRGVPGARGPRRVGGRAGGVILAAPRARAAPRGRDAHSAAARLRSLRHNRWSGVCSKPWCFGRGVTHEWVTLYGPVRAPFRRWCWRWCQGLSAGAARVPSRCAGRRGAVGCFRGVLRPPRAGGCDHAVYGVSDGIHDEQKGQTCLLKFSQDASSDQGPSVLGPSRTRRRFFVGWSWP